MKNVSSDPPLTVGNSEERDVIYDGEALICEEDEALYPAIEYFDNVDERVECDAPCVPYPAEHNAELIGLPPELVSSLPKIFQEGTIIYIHPEFELYERQNRTRVRAEIASVIAYFLDNFPKNLAIITSKSHQNGLTFNKDDTAYLQVINREGIDAVKLFELCTNDSNMELPRYYNDSYEAISNVDLPLLHCLYRIISHDIELTTQNPKQMYQKLEDSRYTHRSITIYIRDLLKMMGYKPNNGHKTEIDVIDRIKSFSNVFGIMASDGSGLAARRAYEVMRFEEYNAETNTVRFASPYLHILALKVLLSGIKDGKPTHSFLVKSNIAKNHNRTDMEAFEIVCAVVKLIERAGGTGGHIRVRKLLERCPSLLKKYEATRSWNKHNVLERAFGKAWKYLREYTELSEKYTNIQLPTTDAKDVGLCKNLEYKIEFKHEGKNKTGSP